MTDIDLQRETINSLCAAQAAGRLTARDLTEHCLKRIEAIDPLVNAILEVNPQALEIADQLDQERSQGTVRGPLHGLPILVKDNIDTADRMQTTAGSLALAGNHAREDAFVIRKLRTAGALLLGKTNLSEWANFRSTRSSSGWSSRGGQTRNPYALDRSPGGSSSGSAVAVATGMCVAAIGTETDGSIVSPAAMNSIVGIKPGHGLVSRTGIVPIAHSQDTAGPMARCVQDAAIVLSAIAGPDPQDPGTGEGGRDLSWVSTYIPDNGHLRGARIGLARNYCGFHEAVEQIVDESLKVLRGAGATVIDGLELTPAVHLRGPEMVVMQTEFKVGLNRYLSDRARGAAVHTLADIIAFNDAHRDRVMPYFRQETLVQSEHTAGLEEETYLLALEQCHRLSREQGIDLLIKTHQLDAVLAPSTCVPWVIDWINGDHRLGGSAGPAAVAGYPNITIPAGYVYELPVGLSFFSSHDTEPKLIRMAGAFEQAAQVRIPPTLATHVGF